MSVKNNRKLVFILFLDTNKSIVKLFCFITKANSSMKCFIRHLEQSVIYDSDKNVKKLTLEVKVKVKTLELNA